MPVDPEVTIAQKLTEPKAGVTDGQAFTQHSIPDLIKGAEFLSGKTIGKKKNKGVIYSKMKPGGSQ